MAAFGNVCPRPLCISVGIYLSLFLVCESFFLLIS